MHVLSYFIGQTLHIWASSGLCQQVQNSRRKTLPFLTDIISIWIVLPLFQAVVTQRPVLFESLVFTASGPLAMLHMIGWLEVPFSRDLEGCFCLVELSSPSSCVCLHSLLNYRSWRNCFFRCLHKLGQLQVPFSHDIEGCFCLAEFSPSCFLQSGANRCCNWASEWLKRFQKSNLHRLIFQWALQTPVAELMMGLSVRWTTIRI